LSLFTTECVCAVLLSAKDFPSKSRNTYSYKGMELYIDFNDYIYEYNDASERKMKVPL
jgi:hypothetical protein